MANYQKKIRWDLYQTVDDCTDADRKRAVGVGYTCGYWDEKTKSCPFKNCRYLDDDGIPRIPPAFFHKTKMIDLHEWFEKEG